MFNATFPEKLLTSYRLRKVYREQKIRKKKVKHTKRPNRKTRRRIAIKASELRLKYDDLTRKGFRIVQLDEMMVTKRTFPTHAWSLPGHNMELDLSQINTEP
jgi:hypothetical protein